MNRVRLNIIRTGIFIAAAAMIAYGIYRGEHSIIFSKAVNVCFECIGLG